MRLPRHTHCVRREHDLPAALVMLKTGASADVARRSLAKSSGNVRRALELHKKHTID